MARAASKTQWVRPGAGAVLVFWVLIGMGFATFAPCILLPEWREYQELRIVEQREQFKIDQLQAAVNDEQQKLEAISSDPATVARLARRDLGYHRPDEDFVVVPGPAPVETRATFSPKPVEPPQPLRKWASYLPDLNYDAIFCNDRTRGPLIVASVALIVIALTIFRRRRPIHSA